MEKDIARLILKMCMGITEDSAPSVSEFESLVSRVASTIKDRLGKPLYPAPSDSLAISVMTPKTAALAFDKVYRIPVLDQPVPEEVGFYFATLPEIGWWAAGLATYVADQLGIEETSRFSLKNSPGGGERSNLRFLCSEIESKFGVTPTIFYHEKQSYDREFLRGARQLLMSYLTDVVLVDEKLLSWEQVIEFRRDTDARIKYRRLVRWIDAELEKSRSADEVTDLMAIRLDDYEWALRKHGLKASVGALSCLLEPKFLAATSATVAATGFTGGTLAAALTGSTMIVGQAALGFGSIYIDGIDALRKENYELAYIHDLKRLLE